MIYGDFGLATNSWTDLRDLNRSLFANDVWHRLGGRHRHHARLLLCSGVKVKSTALRNDQLTARFSPAGLLTHLSAAGRGASLVKHTLLRYLDIDAKCWHSDPKRDDGKLIETVFVKATDTLVRSVHRSEHLEIALQYDLPEKSPLLAVSVQVRGRGAPGKLGHFSMPQIAFADGFNDAFEDEEELFWDGAELGDGRELPCWRVFFRAGHRDGLLLATRSKRDMARFNILADAVDLEPHGAWNYTSNPVSGRPPLIPVKGQVLQAQFEIGPWRKADHRVILRRASLSCPVAVGHLPAHGGPVRNLKGRVFYAVDFAEATAWSPAYSPRKWMRAEMPWAQKGTALMAGTGVRPPALTLNAKLKGLYRLVVGVGNGDGIALRLSGDPETRIRMATVESITEARSPAFSLYLSGTHQPHEIDFGVERMDGRSLRIERFPNLLGSAVLDYVRFEPVAGKLPRLQEPQIALSGFHDVPDISVFTDPTNPDPAAYRANIWEHARCGFKRIYWRIDGQCSDFPCTTNTMRYISAKVHGVYCPGAKAYGRVLQKVDMLRLAVEAGRRYGVEIYGWMRFNNYTGNVQSEFYRKNPLYWEEHEHGVRGGKLCLAIPEVRRHKIDILVEAAGYGLQGLNLGFLRHPPILMFHPVLVESYTRRYGKPPPRQANRPDARFIGSLPPDDPEHVRWYQHRAGFMTLFGQELRAALRARGLGNVKVSIWVRPNHCLFDGIDLPAWLDQGLCDEVVCNGIIGPERCYSEAYDPAVCGLRPEWKRMVQAKAPLVRCLCYGDIARWKQHLPEVLDEGYDGLCTYESDWAVLDPEFIQCYRSLGHS